MKQLILLLLLSVSLANAQESKIVELLNKQLTKEISKYEDETHLKIVQPFHIDKNKKLAFEFEKFVPDWNRWEITKYEVSLDKITSFIKDINIIFRTEGNEVIKTVKTYNEKKELISTDDTYTDLFFTEICKEQNNSGFRDKIVKAFKKSGYIIDSQYWYD